MNKKIKDDTKNLLTKNTFASLSSFIYQPDSIKLENDINEYLGAFILVIFASSLNVFLQNEDQHDLYKLKSHIMNIDWNLLSHFDILDKIDDMNVVNNRKVLIDDFEKYQNTIHKLCLFLQLFKRSLKNIEIVKKTDGQYYICNLELVYEGYQINLEFESTGIKNLVQLFDSFNKAANGGIVFIDEMDANINEVYLNALIEYFMNYTNGQLCFTTHNSSPMDILKENKKSITFLSSNNTITTWETKGNSSPENAYRNRMIEDLPFNIYPTDFIGIFGDVNE